MDYRPWHSNWHVLFTLATNECKCANISWLMKGNRRFIVCYLEGIHNYGRHSEWDKVELCDHPINGSKEQIQSVFEIK